MTDTLATGATWRRSVTIADENGPVDPTELTATLCPEVPITVRQLAAGSYELLLTDTAFLEPGARHWELWGRVGSDMTLITLQHLTIFEACGP